MHRGNMITFVCDSNWLFTEQRHTFPDEVNVYRCQSDAMRTLADMNAYAPLFFFTSRSPLSSSDLHKCTDGLKSGLDLYPGGQIVKGHISETIVLLWRYINIIELKIEFC